MPGIHARLTADAAIARETHATHVAGLVDQHFPVQRALGMHETLLGVYCSRRAQHAHHDGRQERSIHPLISLRGARTNQAHTPMATEMSSSPSRIWFTSRRSTR